MISYRALRVLEFERVLEYAAGFASTDSGRDAILALTPGTDAQAIRDHLSAVDETGRFVEKRRNWTFPLLPDPTGALARLAVDGSVLSPGELSRIGALLAAGTWLLRTLSEEVAAADRFPSLEALGPHLLSEPLLEAALVRTVDPEGRVLDTGSKELGRIRARLGGAHNRAVAHLESLLSRVGDRYRVPGASVTIREGRYVIPVRREGKSAVGGYVHDESASGATVYVEPPSAIERMNRVRALERGEANEIQRILRALTDRCRPLADRLGESLAALAEVDKRAALARVAKRWNGRVPEMTGRAVDIRRGRHPLLLVTGIDAVPFDICLEPGEGVVVVTGPNTGGKTVFLGAVGLIAVLAQSGVIPPVDAGTRLPVFDSFFADVGDGQSIADNLSTFSAHLQNLKEVVTGAGKRSLVLVDELGTGTDPREGEALARALIEWLADVGCTAIVTSHLGGLKRLPAPGNRIVNASLRFDSERLAPTYRFTQGRPGRSYGLTIARSLGFPEEVLDRADAYRDQAEARLDGLLAKLEEKEGKVSRLLANLDRERVYTATLRSELEEREDRLRRAEQAHARAARAETRRMLLDARREVDAAIVRFQARAEAGESLVKAARTARRTVENAARELEGPLSPEAPGRMGSASGARKRLVPGSDVRMKGSDARGILASLEGERALVEIGGVRVTLPRKRLAVAERSGGEASVLPDPPTGPKSRSDALGVAALGPSSPAGLSHLDLTPATTELDLRGQRADEAEASLVRAVDAGVVADLPALRVIHGKGTGVLRERVALVLGRDPRIKRFRPGNPGEGGFGVTVATLR